MYTVCLVNLSSHAVRDPSYVRAVRTAVRYFVFWRWRGEKLKDGPTGCGEVAKGGCLIACNFSVTRSAVLVETRRR